MSLFNFTAAKGLHQCCYPYSEAVAPQSLDVVAAHHLQLPLFSETFSSGTIQVQTVEMMGAGRVVILLLQFQSLLALTASPHINQEVQLLVLGLQLSQLSAQMFVHNILHSCKIFFFASDTETTGRQE